MYILLDPKDDKQAEAVIDSNGKITRAVCDWQKSGAMLVAADKAIKRSGASLADLKGLAVVSGKGRFSATRAAATLANTFAFALNLPVAAVRGRECDWPAAIQRQNAGTLIHATYSGQARIGGGASRKSDKARKHEI